MSLYFVRSYSGGELEGVFVIRAGSEGRVRELMPNKKIEISLIPQEGDDGLVVRLVFDNDDVKEAPAREIDITQLSDKGRRFLNLDTGKERFEPF